MGSPAKLAAAAPPPSVAEIAAAAGVRECLQWFSREKQWINEQHATLCRVPAPTFLEQKRAEWMVTQFRALGCDARVDRGGNVVAALNPGASGPFVAVTAHLDTVLAPRKPEEIVVDPDGALRGPGVADNGAGLAALLALARALKSVSCLDGAAANLLLIANVGEEGEGNLNGIRYLCSQGSLAGRIRTFIVLDGPSTEHITWKALASRRFEVTFTGNGGHSWSDFGAGNPVHALSRAITLFTDAHHELALRNGRPRMAFNFGTINGGASITSIPTESRTKVDIRSENAASIDEMAQLLTSCVERAAQIENERSTTRITARIRAIGTRPGGQLPEDSPLLAHLRSVDAHLGIRAQLDCASTDANIPLSMNLPALSIGAGGQGGGAHTPSEWFHPAGRETALSRIMLLLILLLRDE
jgi:acetylornithine deacetylase/succinyl-diaminopimelate desuccinylase-like protein